MVLVFSIRGKNSNKYNFTNPLTRKNFPYDSSTIFNGRMRIQTIYDGENRTEFLMTRRFARFLLGEHSANRIEFSSMRTAYPEGVLVPYGLPFRLPRGMSIHTIRDGQNHLKIIRKNPLARKNFPFIRFLRIL
jgi:hypothetical protein